MLEKLILSQLFHTYESHQTSSLFFFISLALILALVIFLINATLNEKTVDRELLSPYECGFEPFSSARETFDVHFYLVSLLFLIFDLEVAYLFPWCANLPQLSLQLGFSIYICMMYFLLLLLLGFYYEWQCGALDW